VFQGQKEYYSLLYEENNAIEEWVSCNKKRFAGMMNRIRIAWNTQRHEFTQGIVSWEE
jgi:hypothetical protein